MTDELKNQKHKQRMQVQKKIVDAKIAAADRDESVVILLTGNGKGKSSSGFGMVIRCLGHGFNAGVVQFIKGAQQSGEALFLQQRCPEVPFYAMGTGFTWNTQDRDADIAAAERTWEQAEKMLRDASLHLVLLDELTYMLHYGYLDAEKILIAIKNRPANQSVIITGRGSTPELDELVDTIADINDKKHAFTAGIKARAGVDY
jgi:cob(I)alamin adenosyltransferase